MQISEVGKWKLAKFKVLLEMHCLQLPEVNSSIPTVEFIQLSLIA